MTAVADSVKEPDSTNPNPAAAPWQAQVVTLFPDAFPGPLGLSLSGQALENNVWSCSTVGLREFGVGKHLSVDDTPAGGGAGMVLRADVVGPALDAAQAAVPNAPLLHASPRGRPFTQAMAADLAAGPGVTILAGRFEGVDQRILEAYPIQEVSIGDYVLSGGEVAAMVILDACIRLLPGVVGATASLTEESFADGLLEYPHYTRPRSWRGFDIPNVLLSGDHSKIATWRRDQAQALTAARRPDLLARKPKP